MYTDIQSLKELGLNKSQIARRLGISRPTLNKYYDMDADEYNKKLEGMQRRNKKPDKYHDEILSWLTEYPDLSGAQIQILRGSNLYCPSQDDKKCNGKCSGDGPCYTGIVPTICC